jgi:hypothetical protein
MPRIRLNNTATWRLTAQTVERIDVAVARHRRCKYVCAVTNERATVEEPLEVASCSRFLPVRGRVRIHPL